MATAAMPSGTPRPPSEPRPESPTTRQQQRSSSPLKRRMTASLIQRKASRQAQKQSERERLAKVLEEARKVSIDVLAAQWLNDVDASTDTRMYMVEKLLPSLIFAMEKLLQEAHKRGVVPAPDDADDGSGGDSAPAVDVAASGLNPINFLGQHLMRNNPRFSNFSEASPYMMSMRLVQEKLKQKVYDMEENRMAKIRADVERRRRAVEEESARLSARLRTALDSSVLKAFPEWEAQPGQGVSAALFVAALRSFVGSPSHRACGQLEAPVNVALAFANAGAGEHNMLSREQCLDCLEPAMADVPEHVQPLLARHLDEHILGGEIDVEVFLRSLFDACDHTCDGRLDAARLQRVMIAYFDEATASGAVQELFPEDTAPESGSQQPRMRRPSIDLNEPAAGAGAASGSARKSTVTFPDESPIKEDEAADGAQAEEAAGDKNEVEEEEVSADAGDDAAAAAATAAATAEAATAGGEETAEEVAQVQAPDEGIAEDDVPVEDEAPAEEAAAVDDEEVFEQVMSAEMETHLSLLENARQQLMSRGSADKDKTTVTFQEFRFNILEMLGLSPPADILRGMARAIKEEFAESEEEKRARLAAEERRKNWDALMAEVDNIFDRWDNDGSGKLESSEIAPVLALWKKVSEDEAQIMAKEMMAAAGLDEDAEIEKANFARYFLQHFLPDVTTVEEAQPIFTALTACISRSLEEEKRGRARRAWLKGLQAVADRCFSDPTAVFKKLFEIIAEDAETFWKPNDVQLSVNIALADDYNGPEVAQLHYIAATPDDEEAVVGQRTKRTEGVGVSFVAAKKGLPVHVPSMFKHGHIKLFKPRQLSEECDGALLVVPLRDPRLLRVTKGVIGTLGIDTLASNTVGKFEPHQTRFYKGVGGAISEALLQVKHRQLLCNMVPNCFAWIRRMCSDVESGEFYLARKESPCLLLAKYPTVHHGNGPVSVLSMTKPDADNKHLFDAVASAEVQRVSQADGRELLCVPVREEAAKRVLGVMVLQTAKPLSKAGAHAVTTLVEQLTALVGYIADGDVPDTAPPQGRRARACHWHYCGLQVDLLEDPQCREQILFERLHLLEQRKAIFRLDPDSAFRGLKSPAFKPNATTQELVRLMIMCLRGVGIEASLKTWRDFKVHLTSSAMRAMTCFDPTSPQDAEAMDVIRQRMQNLDRAQVEATRNHLLLIIFDWLDAAVALAAKTALFTKKLTKAMARQASAGGERATSASASARPSSARGGSAARPKSTNKAGQAAPATPTPADAEETE